MYTKKRTQSYRKRQKKTTTKKGSQITTGTLQEVVSQPNGSTDT